MNPRLVVSISILAAMASAARADHGKGSVGGRTISPRTLHEGDVSLDAGMRFQESETFSRARLEEETLAGHDAHSADWFLELSVGASYGMTDHLTLSASVPYVVIHGFIAGEENGTPPPDVLFSEADAIKGLGDASLLAKYSLLGDPVELAMLAGVKIPTGSTRRKDDDGEVLEPDHQPGSGSWDALFGVAAGKQFERLWLGASLLVRITPEGRHEFKPGNTVQAAVKAEYQLTELGTFPRIYGFLELAGDVIAKDRVNGVSNDDTGGVILSMAPGVKARLDDHVSGALSFPTPFYQGLHGFQHEERFGVLFGVSYDF